MPPFSHIGFFSFPVKYMVELIFCFQFETAGCPQEGPINLNSIQRLYSLGLFTIKSGNLCIAHFIKPYRDPVICKLDFGKVLRNGL